jgi:hypothetical protein
MTTVNFDKNALKVIADLSKIVKTKDGNTPIKIVKDEEGIHVKSSNGSKTIIFTVDAPSHAFDFVGTNICFYNYGEFYDYFSLFEHPTITQESNGEDEFAEPDTVVISQGRKKINYPLSDAEVIRGALKNVKWSEPDATFKFSSDHLTNMKKIISLLGDKNNNITYTFKDGTVSVLAKTTINNNSFEDEYDLITPATEEFSITISDEIFKYLLNVDYTVEVNSAGVLRFFFEANGISASIVATAIEEGN